LKNENLLCDKKIILNNKIELRIKGKEDNDFFYFYTYLDDLIPYTAEMRLKKDDLKIIDKKIYRSE
jgi:hypothetical protein